METHPGSRRHTTGWVVAAVALAVLLGCRKPAPSTPADGALSDGAYANRYFGFSLTFPAAWSVASKETEEHILGVGKEAAFGQDAMRRAAATTVLKDSYQLLTILEHPYGTPGISNPSLMVMAEKVSYAPGVRTGKDYLLNLIQHLSGGQIPYKVVREPYEFAVGSATFHRAEFAVRSQTTTRQSYLATVRRGYALSFILTGVSDEEMARLEEIVRSIKFD